MCRTGVLYGLKCRECRGLLEIEIGLRVGLATLDSSAIPAYLTYLILHWISLPSYHILPRPTLASSAILPCPTLSFPILLHPTPSYTVFYCPPNLVLHWILLRFYPVLPYPTTSNHILPCLTFVYPTLRCILLPSYILHWSVHPSYLVLPRPTTTFFVHHWSFQPNILPQPSSSYTGGFVIHPISYPTASYHWIV